MIVLPSSTMQCQESQEMIVMIAEVPTEESAPGGAAVPRMVIRYRSPFSLLGEGEDGGR
jgi:hypothetical protein